MFGPDPGFQQAACGSTHTLLVAKNEVYAFGGNKEGQLGDGTTKDRFEPVKITKGFNNEKIIAVSCGGFHSAVLTESNIYTFGFNQYGQLGDTTTKNRHHPTIITKFFGGESIQSLQCYQAFTYVVTSQGLYTFGYN